MIKNQGLLGEVLTREPLFAPLSEEKIKNVLVNGGALNSSGGTENIRGPLQDQVFGSKPYLASVRLFRPGMRGYTVHHSPSPLCTPLYQDLNPQFDKTDDEFETMSQSLVYADKPQTLDHLEDNIRRVIADLRPQMLEKVIENWPSRLDYIRASRGSPMPEIIFKM
ncbi:hypothetical protein TNCV_1070001 [Trichonephila clavipes]|nr:hypothetical protein TNCV_1070001 [Trichonephila clavipes]